LILADNSYGRLERGSAVWMEGGRTRIRGWVEPKGESAQKIECVLELEEGGPIGRHDREGRLVKGMLDDGRFLLFRYLPHFVAEECAVSQIQT
jgi:hypothetical protein